MPRTNLKQSAQKRAASKVASKVASRSKTKADSVTPPSPATALATPKTSTPTSNGHKPPTSVSTTSTEVPGLSPLSPDSVAGMLPQFNESSYIISDPLNPPEALPQISESQFNKLETTYQGSIRALKATGLALDVADQRFTVISNRAKAFGSGIRAATALERTKGDYLDYQSQVEVTSQKTVTLENNQAKTVNDRAISIHTQTVMDEKLRQAESDAEMARQKTAEKQNQLAEFKKQLGEYLPSK